MSYYIQLPEPHGPGYEIAGSPVSCRQLEADAGTVNRPLGSCSEATALQRYTNLIIIIIIIIISRLAITTQKSLQYILLY